MDLSETELMNLTTLMFIGITLDLHYNKRKSVWMRALISKANVLKLFVPKNWERTSVTITSVHWRWWQKPYPKRLPTLHLTGSRTSYLALHCWHLRICFTGKKKNTDFKIQIGSCLYVAAIHKSLRNFRTRLRNNQDRHSRKEHFEQL